jgi:hypothetical protein
MKEKAMNYAIKYAIVLAVMINSGCQNEATTESPTGAKSMPRQKMDLVNTTSDPNDVIVGHWKRNHPKDSKVWEFYFRPDGTVSRYDPKSGKYDEGTYVLKFQNLKTRTAKFSINNAKAYEVAFSNNFKEFVFYIRESSGLKDLRGTGATSRLGDDSDAKTFPVKFTYIDSQINP